MYLLHVVSLLLMLDFTASFLLVFGLFALSFPNTHPHESTSNIHSTSYSSFFYQLLPKNIWLLACYIFHHQLVSDCVCLSFGAGQVVHSGFI